MIDIHAINPLYPVSGFQVGALVGFTGVGAGALMTPLLIVLFGFQATAVGTDLLYALATSVKVKAAVGWCDAERCVMAIRKCN